VLIGNKNELESLLENVCQFAQDISDQSSQKSAFSFFGRCVQVWCNPQPSSTGGNALGPQILPGFERFVYERLVPAAFAVLSSPQFNPKDGQMLMVSQVNLCKAWVLTTLIKGAARDS
jgi:exportin-T